MSSERKLALIAAVARDRVIGRQGDLPWSIPEDMRHFMQTTLGHAVIMGRKTFESMGKPLPKRTNIVVTSDRAFSAPGAIVVPSFDAALEHAWSVDEEPFVIGGANIYAAALPHLTHVFLTEVDRSVEGDTFFPDTDWAGFDTVSRRTGAEPDVTFVEMVRKQTPVGA